jgi:hypothetical protein
MAELVLLAQVLLGPLELLEQLVFPVLTVVEALLDQLVRLEQLDYKALTEQTDHLVLQVLQVLQDQMVLQV